MESIGKRISADLPPSFHFHPSTSFCRDVKAACCVFDCLHLCGAACLRVSWVGVLLLSVWYSSLQRCVLPIMNLSSNLSRPPSLAEFHQSTDTDSVLHLIKINSKSFQRYLVYFIIQPSETLISIYKPWQSAWQRIMAYLKNMFMIWFNSFKWLQYHVQWLSLKTVTLSNPGTFTVMLHL